MLCKQPIITRSSAGSELYDAALGASDYVLVTHATEDSKDTRRLSFWSAGATTVEGVSAVISARGEVGFMLAVAEVHIREGEHCVASVLGQGT